VIPPDRATEDRAAAAAPPGHVTRHVFEASRIYPGTRRAFWTYLPARYDPASPASLMVFQDGEAYVDPEGWFKTTAALDRLIHAGRMPATVGVFVNAGHHGAELPAQWWNADNRSYEYDTTSDTYARFVLEELLPMATAGLSVTDDPDRRGLAGFSSGGIAAFTVAWERPDRFRRVLSHCGSFGNIRGGHEYPFRIRQTERRPLRVFLQSGAKDVDNEMGHWLLCNQQMEAALRFRGYDVRSAWGDGGHDGVHGGAILAESLEWLWRPADPAP